MLIRNFFCFAAFFFPFTLFTKEIGLYHVGTVAIDVISYPMFVLTFVLLFIVNKLSISRNEALIFLIILLIGMINSLIFMYPIILFFKQFLPIVLFYFVWKAVLENNNPISIFKIYVNYSVIAALIGIVQLTLKYFFNIKLLTHYTNYFIDSIAFEPSHYVVIVLPALIYLYEKRIFNWKFFVLLVSLILTFKVTFFASIIVYFVLRNLKKLKKILLLVPIFMVVMFYVSPEYKSRAIQAIDYVKTNNYNVNHLTVFSMVTNLSVAIDNFSKTYGTGGGLGSHETRYVRYIELEPKYMHRYGLNKKSAHSLIIRIISELGIIGIFLIFMMMYKSLKIQNDMYKIIALASLSHFITKVFKTGSYFDYGTIFFLLIIIFMVKMDNEETSSISQTVRIVK